MGPRLYTLCLVAALAMAMGAACSGDNGLDSPTISVSGPGPDAGTNKSDAARDSGGDTGAVDSRCVGRQAGASCALDHASGVCVHGTCQFLSCSAGFRDCDSKDDNGCETDITRPESCGACGVSCAAPQTCQLSRAGWVCSVAPVCREGHFDLDGDLQNGCEWTDTWGSDGVLVPNDLAPQAASMVAPATFAVAGLTDSARLLTTTGANASPAALPLIVSPSPPTTNANAVTEFSTTTGQTLAVTAWDDALALSSAQGSAADDGTFHITCRSTAEAYPRSFRSAAAGADAPIFASDGWEVVAVDHGASCADDPNAPGAARQLCDQPSDTFGLDDYLRAYYPYDSNSSASADPAIADPRWSFSAAEVASCDACFLNTSTGEFSAPGACLGEAVCQPSTFDASNCGGCAPDPNHCPDFRPGKIVRLSPSGKLVVFTLRGFLVLDHDTQGWHAGPRVEQALNAGGLTPVAAGAAVQKGSVVHIFVLYRDGRLRRLRLTTGPDGGLVAPDGPDIGVPMHENGDELYALTPGPRDVLLVTDPRSAWLVHPFERSARVQQLPVPDVFLGDGRVIFGQGASFDSPAGFSLLYYGLGRYYLRQVLAQ